MIGLALAAALGAAAPSPADAVIAAERAFAAEAAKSGVKGSFLKFAAPDGIMFRPDPKLVSESFPAPANPNAPILAWWPQWAGISRSGDLGFTTGPFTVGGEVGNYYFTVWKKQADGSWKWLFDGGPPSKVADGAKPSDPVAILAPATRAAGSADKALAEVGAVETALAVMARGDARGAYTAVVAPEARLAGSELAPSNDDAGRAAELAARPDRLVLASLGRGASSAGDLVWTYGDACWSASEGPRRGHYVRIWQDRADGWKLVFDQILAVPPQQGGATWAKSCTQSG